MILRSKFLLIILITVLSLIFVGCINQPSSYVGYTIYIWPDENSEATMIIPLVMDNKSGTIDQVMLIEPRFPKGSAFLKIIETDKGPALKITTKEEVQIKFSEDYTEIGAELRVNKTLSMTNLTYDENGRQLMISWVYINSTTNQIPRFVISLLAGDSDKVRVLRIGEKNASNGWHQFTVEEGYGIS